MLDQVPDLVGLYQKMTVVDGAVVGAASLLAVIGLTRGFTTYLTPRWEKRKMRMDQERRDREVIAAHTIGMLRYLVKDGIVTIEAATLHANRIASLAPLKEMSKAEGFMTLKESLAEKHDNKQEVAPTTIAEVRAKTSSMLSNMTARLKPAS